MTRPSIVLFLLGCSLVGTASADDEAGFVPMFDGKTLAGWTKVGGTATYRVEGDEIVGVVDPASKDNTFLKTDKYQEDFILRLDLKLDIPGNSGIQFRSATRPTKGSNLLRVFGYQCEVDPSKRAWTGGLYDEARRAWLQSLDGQPEAQKAFKVEGWNSFEIEARGPVIRIKVNGVLCTDYLDTMDMAGFIALQVHTGKEGQIRWKNVRIKDLGKSRWSPLWDGETLTGWEAKGGGKWTVENDAIRGTHLASDPVHGHLFSKAAYDDFAVRLQFRTGPGNSGLYFRAEEGGSLGVQGFQAEIDIKKDLGGLYETEGRGWVVQPKPQDVAKWTKPNDWNDLSVVAIADRIVVHVNGSKTAEVKADPGRRRGKFALQLHGGEDMDIQFRRLQIMPLSEAK